MINKNEIFTFTLIYRNEDEKVIFIQKGEVPAKSEEEAETVLTSKNEDEKDTIDKLISKIFKNCEPGSEESLSATLQEFEDRYDIALEELEEEVGKDLDNDQEKNESDEHEDKVLDTEEKQRDIENALKEPDVSIISIDDLTDPMGSLLKLVKSRYTNPIDYLEEELPECIETGYDPALIEEIDTETPTLEEGASPQELVRLFINLARVTKKGIYNIAAVTELFNELHVTNPDAKLEALRLSLRTGNIKLFSMPNQNAIQGRLEKAGEPLLVVSGTPVTALPQGAKEVLNSDSTAINQAISKFAGIS